MLVKYKKVKMKGEKYMESNMLKEIIKYGLTVLSCCITLTPFVCCGYTLYHWQYWAIATGWFMTYILAYVLGWYDNRDE